MKERYHVTGMTCSACSSRVEKVVNKLEGVEKASVNLLTSTMDVVYDEGVVQAQEIIAEVEKAGYGASLMGASGSCGANGVCGESGTNAGQGAGSAGNGVGAGQAVSSRNSVAQKVREESRAMKWRLGISIGFLIPLMYVAMYHMFHDLTGIPVPDFMMKWFHGNENAVIFALTQFLLVLPILYMNRKFFAVGFKTLLHLSPNMDSLIAVGASASLGYGLFALYRMAYGLGHGDMALVEHYSHDLYFESAGMILTLITVGKYLESRSKGKTSEAITKLMDLSPKMAVRLNADGSEEEIPTEAMRAGDIFLVKPGSLVPVDGVVLEGRSSVDEAAITGESIPVEKTIGDKVVSATMNKAGFLQCRADRVGEDTTLSQIIRLVEEASGSKAPIAQLADKVAGVFVPVVMGISLVTLIGWLIAGAEVEFAISTAIAVLVISCPCALGLATPVAIMVGTGVGAGNGILIKSGEALQRARDVNAVVLDKTGTLTEGKLRVMGVYGYAKGLSPENLLTLAAALEHKSEHPLAEAVIKEAESFRCPSLAVKDFKAVFGRGIEGVIGEMFKGEKATLPAETKLYLGNQAYLSENGVELTAIQKEALNRVADEGETPLLLATDKEFLAIISVADEIKRTSRRAIEAWQKMGVRVVMLTGDNKRTAEAVGRRLGLSEVVAEVLPQDKEKQIRKLKEEGLKVAMIGDGINDAPALASADVGMAIGAGTDVAIESADIILMKNDLRDAVTAMRLSRQVIRNIKQNLFWAFFYNCIGIPLAAGLWYPMFGLRLTPMFGAAAMSMSSVFVVCNALRLKTFRSGFKSRETAGDEVEGAGAVEAQADLVNDENSNITNQGGTNMTKVITVEGMMCGHCTGRVQKVLEAVEGVTSVEMSLENKTATVELSAEVADEVLSGVITEAGYEVVAIQ